MAERDQRVRRLLQQGVPKSRIAQLLGINRSTVSRIAASVGYPSQRRGRDDLDWIGIRAFYEIGNSAAECMRHFGFGASTWDAAINRGEIVPRPRTSQQPPGKRRREVAELLEQGIGVAEIAERLGVSKPTVCYHARKLGVPAQAKFARRFDWAEIQRVYESGIAMRECKRQFGRCGISDWQSEPLSLQLHHENGDGTDNRLANLSFLCPNCHSQTDTYGGRNGHKKPKPHLELVETPTEDGEEVA